MHLVRLVVLGAPGVGKTTLIENFLSNCVLPLKPSSAAPTSTSEKTPGAEVSTSTSTARHSGEEIHSYACSVLLNDLILQVKIADVPPATFFSSTSSSIDWGLGDPEATSIRSADGFILVFDLTSPASFQYLKMMRDHLMEGKGKDTQKTVFVIGNKADCILSSLFSSRHHHHHLPHHSSHDHHHHHEPPPAFKELAAIVRKQWKSPYWELSALHVWRVHSLFMRILEAVTQQRKELYSHLEQRRDHSDHHHLHEEHHYHHAVAPTDQTQGGKTQTSSYIRPVSEPQPDSACLIL